MAYIIVLKKIKNDHKPFPTTRAIELYLNNFGQNDLILGAPGFLSYTTNTIKNFCSQFMALNKSGKNLIALSYGMNGGKNARYSNTKIFDEHYKYFQPKTTPFSTNDDHSKFLIFVENCAKSNDEYVFNLENMKGSHVKAILIGSSNLSYLTYFGGNKSTADKGEADILFLNDSLFKNDNDAINFVETIKEDMEEDSKLGIILSKEIGSNTNLNDFLSVLLRK